MENNIVDINEVTIRNFINTIRPEDIEMRKQIDFGYSYDKKTAILYEIRPLWDDPKKKTHIEFAKIRFYTSKKKMEFILDAFQRKMETL